MKWAVPHQVNTASFKGYIFANYLPNIGGIQNFAGNLAGILITTFTGVMLVLTKGSFLIPLAVAGGLCVVGALSYLFVVGKVEPLPLLPKR